MAGERVPIPEELIDHVDGKSTYEGAAFDAMAKQLRTFLDRSEEVRKGTTEVRRETMIEIVPTQAAQEVLSQAEAGALLAKKFIATLPEDFLNAFFAEMERLEQAKGRQCEKRLKEFVFCPIFP